MGPPVTYAQATLGRCLGSTKGERPRWSGPNLNMVLMGSFSVGDQGAGAGSRAPPGDEVAATVAPGGAWGRSRQTQVPRSQMRWSLQSRSE